MNDQKIKVSLDEVNSTNVDAELQRQDVAGRMAEHQKKIKINSGCQPILNNQGGFFRKSMVYMAIFGIIFSVIAWGVGEGIINATENDTLYPILLCAFIAIGLSIAEGFVSKNFSVTIKNGLLGAILGASGGFVFSLFINYLYSAMGGGRGGISVSQIFARGIAWGFLGAFVAIAPGIIMRSRKKFLLGIAGGAIGGIIGGLLFDLIGNIFHSGVPARFVNIVGLGVGAAVATVFLENIAKQGWLKVAAGLIAGKQFILYRNPTVIGSSPKCEIYLFKDPQIAGKHAAINNHNGDFIITAIAGSPIFVNNAPVQQQKLKTGDQIKISNTIFVFEAKVLKDK